VPGIQVIWPILYTFTMQIPHIDTFTVLLLSKGGLCGGGPGEDFFIPSCMVSFIFLCFMSPAVVGSWLGVAT
jgi:hypothetical protein